MIFTFWVKQIGIWDVSDIVSLAKWDKPTWLDWRWDKPTWLTSRLSDSNVLFTRRLWGHVIMSSRLDCTFLTWRWSCLLDTRWRAHLAWHDRMIERREYFFCCCKVSLSLIYSVAYLLLYNILIKIIRV